MRRSTGVIVRSQPGPSVVDPSRLDGCGVERINRFAVWRGGGNVHRTGRYFLFHDPEVSAIVDREAGPLRAWTTLTPKGYSARSWNARLRAMSHTGSLT